MLELVDLTLEFLNYDVKQKLDDLLLQNWTVCYHWANTKKSTCSIGHHDDCRARNPREVSRYKAIGKRHAN